MSKLGRLLVVLASLLNVGTEVETAFLLSKAFQSCEDLRNFSIDGREFRRLPMSSRVCFNHAFSSHFLFWRGEEGVGIDVFLARLYLPSFSVFFYQKIVVLKIADVSGVTYA